MKDQLVILNVLDAGGRPLVGVVLVGTFCVAELAATFLRKKVAPSGWVAVAADGKSRILTLDANIGYTDFFVLITRRIIIFFRLVAGDAIGV